MNNLDRLEQNFYQKTEHDGGTLYVSEQDKAGEAKLTVHCSSEAVAFTIKPGKGFTYLQRKNTPDGIVLMKNKEQNWELHIFECKKTVSESSWDKAKRQFEGGILHAYMLRGLLDLPPFSKICLYTVYRYDKLLKQTTNPSLLRQPVGLPVTRQPYKEWEDGSIFILNTKIPHRRIQLNDSGEGEYQL